MAFVYISIVEANLAIIAWSIVSVGVEMTFRDLFDSVKAGKYAIIPASEKLTRMGALPLSVIVPLFLNQRQKKKTLSFSPSKQYVLNVDTIVQCEECNMWRLLFSRKKLSVRDKKQLQDILADTAYTCGATLEEIDLPDHLKSVMVRVHNCYDPVEKLYYSAELGANLHLLQQ